VGRLRPGGDRAHGVVREARGRRPAAGAGPRRPGPAPWRSRATPARACAWPAPRTAGSSPRGCGPRRGARPRAAFTRSLWPVARAAQPVRLPSGVRIRDVPVVANAGEGLHVVACGRPATRRPGCARSAPGRAPAAAGRRCASTARRARRPGRRGRSSPAPTSSSCGPRPARPAPRSSWPAARPTPRPRRTPAPRSARRCAARPATAWGVASAGARVLVAWPGAAGGVVVAERS
jgi:hypothetical protein